MLSRSIGDMATAMAEELANGAVMPVSMQWRMVDIMREWQRLAVALEEGKPARLLQAPIAFRPTIVGGSEHSPKPESPT